MMEGLVALTLKIYRVLGRMAVHHYFLHRKFEPYNNENDANNNWKKIGTPRSFLDATL